MYKKEDKAKKKEDEFGSQRNIFSSEEEERFMCGIKEHRLGSAFRLALKTGLREGELLALKWSDVDFQNKQISISKNLQRTSVFGNNKRETSRLEILTPKTNESMRKIPLTDDVLKELKGHQKRQESEKRKAGKEYSDIGLIFCTALGKYIEPRNFARIFYNNLKKLDIPQRGLHSLRRTFATRCAESGMTAETLKTIMGHENITTTSKYYIFVKEQTRRNELENVKFSF